MDSLFHRLGGRRALHTLIDLFYYKVLLDPELKKKFDGADMMSLKQHQLEFMSCISGGPDEYPMERLRAAHKDLHITDAQFNAICRHLEDAMTEMGIAQELVSEVLGIISTMHDDIVVR